MAKKTIADVNIKLSAGTSGLQADFQKAAGLAKGFGADVMGIATKIGGALAGAFAVGSIASGVREQMQSIDAIAKTADQIGASVAQVQALNLAADLAGVGVSELAGGFRKMAATVSDAANGSETAAAALARVGLSAQALAGMSPVQQLAAVIEGLQGVGDATERLSLAQDLLGRTGQVFLSLDAAQIRAAADDVDRLGLAMTRADAAKVEEANDAITRMTASVTALYQELAIGLAPVITQVADGITNMVSVISNMDSATVIQTAKLFAFAAGFGAVLVLIPRIIAGIQGIVATMRTLASAQAITAALSGPAGWAKLAVAVGVGTIAVAGVEAAFDSSAAAATTAAAAADSAAAAVDRTSAAKLADLVEKYDEVAAAAIRLEAGISKESGGGAGNGIKEFKLTVNGEEKRFKSREEAEKAFDAASKKTGGGWQFKPLQTFKNSKVWDWIGLGDDEDKAAEAVQKVKKEIEGTTAAAKQGAAAVGEQAQATADWADNSAKAFEQMRRSADSLTREMQTPMEKYDADMAELQKLWDQRLISPETNERAQSKYGEDLEKALETQEQITNLQRVGTAGVGAVQAGTAAAFSAVQTASREQREALAAEKATAAATKQANEHLKQIANNTKAGGVTIGKAEIK